MARVVGIGGDPGLADSFLGPILGGRVLYRPMIVVDFVGVAHGPLSVSWPTTTYTRPRWPW